MFRNFLPISSPKCWWTFSIGYLVWSQIQVFILVYFYQKDSAPHWQRWKKFLNQNLVLSIKGAIFKNSIKHYGIKHIFLNKILEYNKTDLAVET